MRAFLTLVAFVARISFLVWLTDIWRSNEVGFTQVIKNVFVKTGEAPYVEAFATVVLIPMVLALMYRRHGLQTFLLV